jgi:DNA-damage-inducible protein J
VKKRLSKKRDDDAAKGDGRCSPSDAEVPNAITREAIAELEAGKGKRFASVKALMADLNAHD